WATKFEYQLFKNIENYGILVFPKQTVYIELDQYIKSIGFLPVESGIAVMRSGSKGLNSTYMMPKEIQEKHQVKQFITIQVLSDHMMLIGIYDPEWGLTLPNEQFKLDEVKERIPRTLDIFRGPGNSQKQILWRLE
ncbi:MAG: hypothetical protein ACE5EK_10785, partial [Nitrospinales bacterium]